jgi:hypothetical protein
MPPRMMKGPDGNNAPVDQYGLPITFPNRQSSLYLQNGQKLAINYWTVEVVFKTGASVASPITLPFNNVITGFLLNSFIWNIEAYSAATMTKTPLGNTPITQAALSAGYLNLQNNLGYNFWTNKPLRDLQTINDTATLAGKNYPDSLQGTVINWQNSTILLADPSSLATSTQYSLMLGIGFSLFSNWMEDGQGTKNPNQAAINT